MLYGGLLDGARLDRALLAEEHGSFVFALEVGKRNGRVPMPMRSELEWRGGSLCNRGVPCAAAAPRQRGATASGNAV
jgi:hypothetical protein